MWILLFILHLLIQPIYAQTINCTQVDQAISSEMQVLADRGISGEDGQSTLDRTLESEFPEQLIEECAPSDYLAPILITLTPTPSNKPISVLVNTPTPIIPTDTPILNTPTLPIITQIPIVSSSPTSPLESITPTSIPTGNIPTITPVISPAIDPTPLQTTITVTPTINITPTIIPGPTTIPSPQPTWTYMPLPPKIIPPPPIPLMPVVNAVKNTVQQAFAPDISFPSSFLQFEKDNGNLYASSQMKPSETRLLLLISLLTIILGIAVFHLDKIMALRLTGNNTMNPSIERETVNLSN